MADTDVGKKVKLYREGREPVVGKIKKYVAGRDSGDHLIEFADGPNGDGAGPVVRHWFVGREPGTHQNGTFELLV